MKYSHILSGRSVCSRFGILVLDPSTTSGHSAMAVVHAGRDSGLNG